jgi:glycerol-3-phosphate dehydrogenase (NAD(P)+)
MPTNVAVIGAGSWGTAVAALASRNTATVLWARQPELADDITRTRVNARYLPDYVLPDGLECSCDLEEAVRDADVVVMAVPSHGFRDVLRRATASIGRATPIVSLTKGFEVDSLQRMTEVIGDEVPGRPAGVLTGPNLAKEIMAGWPAAAVIAFGDLSIATDLQPLFGSDAFRLYTHEDVVGCEVAGALKNVMALAVGMADGMGFGDNTRAALMTRGLAELTRLGVALGGAPLTFAGLAGMGDLVATCTSRQSRNRGVGEQLGRGRPLAEIIAEMNMVAEGVKTVGPVVALARRNGVEMPIAEQVLAVVEGRQTAADTISALMSRRPRHEQDRP